MIDRKLCKENAKNQIKGSIGIIFLISLVYSIAVSAIFSLLGGISFFSAIGSAFQAGGNPEDIVDAINSAATSSTTLLSIASIISIFFIGLFAISFARVYLNLINGNKPEFADGFQFQFILKAALLYFLIDLFVSLWSILLVVPGIIKKYSYSQAFYILAENPDISALEAIKRSKELTNGYKGSLFVLELSFILWILLTSITCGLAGIYVAPYMASTKANFYQAIKAEKGVA